MPTASPTRTPPRLERQLPAAGPGDRLDVSRPVLVIDGASRGDIGVVRSLGLAGIPVHLLAIRARTATTASRFVTRVHEFPGWEDEEGQIAALRRIAASLPHRPVVMASGDTALRFLSRNRERFEDLADHDLAPHELIETCLDKDRFGVVARRLGLPVPDTFVPSGAAEVRERAAGLAYPVFVKPVHREDWARLPDGIVSAVKGLRVDDAATLTTLFDRLEAHGAARAVVQTMVQGADDEHMSVHAYVSPDGEVLGAFTGKKLRIWPPHAGVGAQVLSLAMPAPAALALDALRTLGYHGFAILQFKRDAARGVFELLEINCRYSTWTELPTRCGCNFPAVAYAVVTGQRPPEIRQREGISWLDFARDRQTLSTYRESGEWTWLGYLRSLSTVRCGAFFAWDDPGPFLHALRRGSA